MAIGNRVVTINEENFASMLEQLFGGALGMGGKAR